MSGSGPGGSRKLLFIAITASDASTLSTEVVGKFVDRFAEN